MKLVYLAALLFLAACTPDTSEWDAKIARQAGQIQQLSTDLKKARSQTESCEKALQLEQKHVKNICADVKERGQVKLKAQRFSVGKSWAPIPCLADSKIKITKTHIDKTRVYFSYEVGGATRFTNALYYGGKFKDQGVLYLTDGAFPVLVTISSCFADLCELSCMEVKTQELVCTSPTKA